MEYADRIYKLIGTHHENGVTFDDFMRAHKDQLSDRSSVLAAINHLKEEGKVFTIDSWGGPGYLQRVKLYAYMIGVRAR